MSSELHEVADAVSGLTIEGPGRDALEQRLSEEIGLDVSISGPDGTTGEAAIARVVESIEPALFDNSVYRDAPAIDGQAADTIDVSFSGKVSFDAASDEGRRLFADLTLGKEVELRVAGVVSKKNGSWKRKADDSEVVTGVAGIAVETLHMLTPEQL